MLNYWWNLLIQISIDIMIKLWLLEFVYISSYIYRKKQMYLIRDPVFGCHESHSQHFYSGGRSIEGKRPEHRAVHTIHRHLRDSAGDIRKTYAVHTGLEEVEWGQHLDPNSIYKDHLSRYRYSNFKDKSVVGPAYLYNGNSYAGKWDLYIEATLWLSTSWGPSQ